MTIAERIALDKRIAEDLAMEKKDARQFLDSYVKHLTCDTKLSAGSFTIFYSSVRQLAGSISGRLII